MKHRILVLVVMLFLAACGKGDITTTENQSGTNQGVLLRINVKPGDTWTLAQQQTILQNLEVLGQSETMVITTTNSLVNTVIEPATDGNINYTSLFQSMVMTQTINGETTVTDFTDPQGLLGTQFLVGKTLTTTVAPNGEIKDVSGVDQLLGESSSAAMGPMVTQFKDAFIKNPGATSYPEQPVNVGDSWTQRIELPIMAMQTSIAITYTVEQITSETVELSLIGKGVLAADETTLQEMVGASDQEMNDVHMEMNIAIDINGTMSIETATGLPRSQDYNQIMKGAITMGKTGEKSIEVPINMVQTMKVTKQ